MIAGHEHTAHIARLIRVAHRGVQLVGGDAAQRHEPGVDLFEPAEVALVAAHNSDLAAARRIGFRTCFVARPNEKGPGQDKDLRAEQDWDFIARDFVHLADELGC